jgi:protoporphyrinogen oxidase
MVKKPHIIILGAGPAGLGAAFRLAQRQIAKVTVLEQEETVGGNAASFEISGLKVDYGSHRLHPACDPEILQDIQILLGDDLLNRPRHGRIRLCGKWIHFPLKPVELIHRLPASFSLGVANDIIAKIIRRNSDQPEKKSFASVLETGLGRAICREFYFPYAQKIWGLTPNKLSAEQAWRRISTGSFGKLFQRMLSSLHKTNSRHHGRFFYPRDGFGQISESLSTASMNAGAAFHMGTRVKAILTNELSIKEIFCEKNEKTFSIRPDIVWSTIPITDLIQYLVPSPPASVVEASKNIDYRAMILIYLVLEQDRFSEYDAHYFPEPNIPITRLSEPKNYSNIKKPLNRTVLCAEIPCSPYDSEWKMKDDELKRLVLDSLKPVSLPVESNVKEVTTHRLTQAYPVYRLDYEVYFNQIDKWLSNIENLLTFGRQGLFVHDNTHHALFMAYAAVNCLNEFGHFEAAKWQNYRKIFNMHVVED